jgi:hypothetical protein
MVLSADDMGDPHGVIVDHDGELVGREPVGPDNDKVPEIACMEAHRPPDQVLEDDLSGGDSEPVGRMSPGILDPPALRFAQVAAASAVAGRTAACQLG